MLHRMCIVSKGAKPKNTIYQLKGWQWVKIVANVDNSLHQCSCPTTRQSNMQVEGRCSRHNVQQTIHCSSGPDITAAPVNGSLVITSAACASCHSQSLLCNLQCVPCTLLDICIYALCLYKRGTLKCIHCTWHTPRWVYYIFALS